MTRAWGALALLAALLAATPAARAAESAAGTTDETKLLIPDSSATTPGGAAAADAAPAVEAPGVDTWDFVRMIVVLALVVGLIYGVFWLLRRGARAKTSENEMIRVLGSRGLAGNRALHLVEVGRAIYLVGSAENGVNLVAEVKDPETIDTIRVQAAEEGGKPRRGFAATLARLLTPPETPKPASGASGAGPTLGAGAAFLRRSRDRLRRLGGGR